MTEKYKKCKDTSSGQSHCTQQISQWPCYKRYSIW